METEKLREFFKEWAKENGLILIRLSSGQYNSPKRKQPGKHFRLQPSWHTESQIDDVNVNQPRT